MALKATPPPTCSVIFTFRVAFIASRILSKSKRIFFKALFTLGGHWHCRTFYQHALLQLLYILCVQQHAPHLCFLKTSTVAAARKAEVKIPRRLHVCSMYCFLCITRCASCCLGAKYREKVVVTCKAKKLLSISIKKEVLNF